MLGLEEICAYAMTLPEMSKGTHFGLPAFTAAHEYAHWLLRDVRHVDNRQHRQQFVVGNRGNGAGTLETTA